MKVTLDIPEITFKDRKEFYIFLIRYTALLLDRSMPSKKEINFMLGLLWAKYHGIEAKTSNRFFSEFFTDNGWHHSNLHNYRDRLLVDKWITMGKDQIIHFHPDVKIPEVLEEGLTVAFHMVCADNQIYTRLSEE